MIYKTETDYPMRIEYTIANGKPDIDKIQVQFYEYWLDVPQKYFEKYKKDFEKEIAEELYEQDYYENSDYVLERSR